MHKKQQKLIVCGERREVKISEAMMRVVIAERSRLAQQNIPYYHRFMGIYSGGRG